MKQIYYLFFILTFCNQIWSQNNSFPQGAYTNIEELVRKEPSVNVRLKVEKQTFNSAKWVNSANDYELRHNSLTKKNIKKKILAYAVKEDLFINCYRYHIQEGYSKVLMSGKYLVFTAGLSSDLSLKTYQLQENKDEKFWKYVGVKGQDISEINPLALRFLYVVDTFTNRLYMIDEIGMRKLLVKSDSELLENYMEEIAQTKDKEKTVFKFLALLNEAQSL